MANQPEDAGRRATFQVSTAQRPDFKHPLAVYVFDARGELVHRAEVRDGKVELPLPSDAIGRARVFVVPIDARIDTQGLTAARLQRLGAYEPVLQAGGPLIDRIDVPGTIIDLWPFCFCWVRGKVVRYGDNRAVCNARVHICEVDRIPLWIVKLPDVDIFRLRDDLLEVVRNPPIPRPGPGPDPGPIMQRAARSTLRFADDTAARVSLNPQPLPPGERVALNPQPLPPREAIILAPELHSRLRSTSTLIVRDALVENWKLLLPWFCYWPHWWWLFRCDEVAVITTDAHGVSRQSSSIPAAAITPISTSGPSTILAAVSKPSTTHASRATLTGITPAAPRLRSASRTRACRVARTSRICQGAKSWCCRSDLTSRCARSRRRARRASPMRTSRSAQ
jgi:hypothetical protein